MLASHWLNEATERPTLTIIQEQLEAPKGMDAETLTACVHELVRSRGADFVLNLVHRRAAERDEDERTTLQ